MLDYEWGVIFSLISINLILFSSWIIAEPWLEPRKSSDKNGKAHQHFLEHRKFSLDQQKSQYFLGSSSGRISSLPSGSKKVDLKNSEAQE